MASTYPADVRDAAAWSKAHPDVKGDAAINQVQSEPWEPAVQSLVAFPQVLAMMDARPGDVQKLGDAFLANPGRVMDRVQFLRKRAQDAGNLQTTSQQKVSIATEGATQAIVIEPAQPQQVFVPVYQPTVVYGAWPYPAYPPVYWPPPPRYYPGVAFVAGVAWGAAIVGVNNALWGGFGWGRNDVNINVNRFNSVNVNRNINNSNFNYNPQRRGDVPYRDANSRERYGGQQELAGARERDAFRGNDTRDAQRSQAAETLKARGADPAAGRERLQGADRERANTAVRNTDRAERAGGGGGRDNALSGVRDGGASKAIADRGRASRTSSAQHGGGSRAGAGMARGGGGGGGGGLRNR